MSEPFEVFFRTAKSLGCPADQVENFLSAGYVPQPKQLEFHAAARDADRTGGCDEIGFRRQPWPWQVARHPRTNGA